MLYCKRCKKTKEPEEFTRRDKVWKQCTKCYNICQPSRKRSAEKNKEQRLQYVKEWRKNNPDKVKANNQRLYEKNKDQYLQQKKEYYEQNKEEIKAKRKKHWQENRERLCAKQRERYHANREKYLEAVKQYAKNNRDKINKKVKEKYHNDPQFKLSTNLRTKLRHLIFRHAIGSYAVDFVGCTREELMDHLEHQFTKGMTWENYGEWQIDHIKPVSMFDLTNDKEKLICFNYLNLQPLWKTDNLRKGNKF